MVNPNPDESEFLQFLKYDMSLETENNFMPVIIKALLESGLGYFENDPNRPYMQRPPILSTEEMYATLTEAQKITPGWRFDAKEAVDSVEKSMEKYVSVSNGFGLTLEFMPGEIPEMLKICQEQISISNK
tara:strand:- start:541 stop:930 length:390 start_codon:yes stop_codon:yes gene_type:complete